MFGIGQLECVSCGIVCGVFYCVDNDKALVSEDDHQERELCVKLCRFVVETRPGHLWNVCFFYLIYACRFDDFMHFTSLFI